MTGKKFATNFADYANDHSLSCKIKKFIDELYEFFMHMK